MTLQNAVCYFFPGGGHSTHMHTEKFSANPKISVQLDCSPKISSTFFLHNLKIYNLTKHIYKNDTIGSMIGMATLNDL